MKIITTFHLLGAEAYGVGDYSCGNFEQACSAGSESGQNGGGNPTTGSPSGTTTGGSLVNTGYDVIVPVAIAGALIVSSAVLFITKFVRNHRPVNKA